MSFRMKSILFDFNGTLFFDYHINYDAWKKTLKEIYKNDFDFDGFYTKHRSIRNNLMLKAFSDEYNLALSCHDIEYYSKYKETMYREYVVNERIIELEDGVEELLNKLKNENTKINLVTASIKENVDFYFDNFNLQRWFDRKLIVYDDGVSSNKSEMYMHGAENINEKIENVIIFEDSKTSIEEAINAGCKSIVYVNSSNTNFNKKEIKLMINSYKQIDYKDLLLI